MSSDPDERAAGRQGWESAAAGWGRNADLIREWSMPVSVAMIDALDLRPGHRVLELAAGPGDTGFMAAELIQQPDDGGAAQASEAGRRAGSAPPATLICSDGAEAMLEVARERAEAIGLAGVEFRQLELEWIDLDTATVDAVLCRWGIMFTVDPGAAAREIRRVLRPDGRAALAVWGLSESNPWATIPNAALIDLGHLDPPDPSAPSMFSMGADGCLADLLHDGGFTEVSVISVGVTRRYEDVDAFLYETRQMSPTFGPVIRDLDAAARDAVAARVGEAVRPFAAAGGGLEIPGRALVAGAFA